MARLNNLRLSHEVSVGSRSDPSNGFLNHFPMSIFRAISTELVDAGTTKSPLILNSNSPSNLNVNGTHAPFLKTDPHTVILEPLIVESAAGLW